jgi:2',3'-cyclic-nucleotide 2'-phosphodiesterase
MNLLFFGDLIGRAGRTAVIENLPEIREKHSIDFVCVNAENAAAGFGITSGIVDDLLQAGVDAITLGNHAFDNKEIMTRFSSYPQLVRPLNIARSAPGVGSATVVSQNKKRVLVMNVLGRVFMSPNYSDPFLAVDEVLASVKLGVDVDAVLIDVHAETTSEKMALGHWVDGRASMVVGTHTHIPTADHHILSNGTAYQTDVGMCGDYDSVIGMNKTEPIRRFVTGMSMDRFAPATNTITICGVLVETDDKTGLATAITPFRQGGILSQSAIQ